MSIVWFVSGILLYVQAILGQKASPKELHKKELGFIIMLLCFVLSLLNR